MSRMFHPRLTAFLLLLLAATHSHAQWVKTTGPDSVRVLGTINGAKVYAGTGSGVFLSQDSGTAWAAMNTGLTNTNIRSILVRPGLVLAGTEGGGVFRSVTEGTAWIQSDQGLTNPNVSALAVAAETDLYAGTEGGGVFRSTTTDPTWNSFNSGLTNRTVYALVVGGLVLRAGTADGIFERRVDLLSWSRPGTGLPGISVRALVVAGSNLFAGTEDGIFRSAGNPVTWTPVNAGLPSLAIHALAAQDGNVFAGTDSGVFLLAANSDTWIAVSTGFTPGAVRALAVGDAYLLAGRDDGIWRRPLSQMATAIHGVAQAAPGQFRLTAGREVSFDLSSPSRVSLEAFDPSGRRVATLLSEPLPSGSHSRLLRPHDLPEGLLFLRLRTEAWTETQRILWTR